jgi:hypothetical protein
MITMATDRKSKSNLAKVQPTPDPHDLRSQTNGDHDEQAVAPCPTGWPKTAEAAFPNFMQVVNAATVEAITMRTCSERDIQAIVARQSLR